MRNLNLNIHSVRRYFILLPITLSIIINLYRYKTMPGDHEMMNDEREYESIAKSILEGKSTTDFYYNEYSIDQRDIGLLITPVYSSFIALVYTFFGQTPEYVYLFQFFFSLIILILFYNILKKYTTELFACIATCFLSIYWPLWVYNFTLMMEVPSILLLMIIVWLTEKFIVTKSAIHLYVLSLLWGCLIFMNNRFILFYVILLVFMFIILKDQLKLTVKKMAVSISIVILILLPWHVRQFIVYGEPIIFTPLRSQSILNKDLVKSLTAGVNNELTEFPAYSEFMMIYGAKEHSNDKESGMDSKDVIDEYNRIRSNWENRDPLWIFRFRENFRIFRTQFDVRRGTDVIRFTDSYGLKMNALNAITLLPALIMMPFGFYYSFRRKQILFQMIGVLYLSNVVLLMLYDLVVERYTYLVLPLVFLLGAFGIWNIFNFKSRQ